jgi:hypothetical protein
MKAIEKLAKTRKYRFALMGFVFGFCLEFGLGIGKVFETANINSTKRRLSNWCVIKVRKGERIWSLERNSRRKPKRQSQQQPLRRKNPKHQSPTRSDGDAYTVYCYSY